MRERSVARAPEATRKKLVAAAAELFNSVGYFGIDSNRIAREAGYASGTFYVHFSDKLEIFLEVYRWWAELEWQAIAAVFAAGAPGRSENARIAKVILRYHRKWRIFRSSLRALTATDDRVHRARVAQRQRQLDQISASLRSRGVRQTPARIYRSLLLFEILCDAIADGDTAILGIKERDILAQLSADVGELLGSGGGKSASAVPVRRASASSGKSPRRRAVASHPCPAAARPRPKATSGS